MKRAVLTILVLWLAGRAHPQDAYERDIGSKLMAFERLVRVQALSSKDLSTLNEFLSDEFVFVSVDGIQKSKAELLSDLQKLDSLRYSAEEMMVRVHGETAVVTGLFRITAVQRGKASVRQGRFLDTWLQTDGRWLMVASVSIPAS